MQENTQVATTPPLSGADLVAQINKALQTIATDFAGPDDPAAKAFAYCTWADTGNTLIKRRNEANTAWETLGGLFTWKADRNGDGTQNFDVASLNGGPLAGLRNRIINGALQINQRGYVSGAATTAGQYTLDRWKVTGTGGITFSTASGKTTVTIPGGQTLQQVIEDVSLPSGDYVLSWEGTAQGRVDSGSYGASGAVTVTLAGGVNSTVEFNAGTLANVQLEPGTIATVFESLPIQTCLELCWRYGEVGYYRIRAVDNASAVVIYYNFRGVKRATPTVATTGASHGVADINTYGFSVVLTASTGVVDTGLGKFSAFAEL